MDLKLAFLGLVVGIGATVWTTFVDVEVQTDLIKLSIENNIFYVEEASTEEEKAIGLMNRHELKTDEGMLFVYSQEVQPSFWMKNTLIPLDIIYIGADKKIKQITTAQPCPLEALTCPTYPSNSKIQYVLELNAGTSTQKEIEVGDLVSF